MDILLQDLRYATRKLLKSPGFTLIAVLTLALGIGANSAIFSVVNGVLVSSLPYPEPGELVGIYHTWEGRRIVMSPDNFRDVRAQAAEAGGAAEPVLEEMAAYTPGGVTLTGNGDPVELQGAEVATGYFDVLDVQPLLGRTFLPEENEPGRARVAILSHRLWQQRFGADPGILGQTVRLDGNPHEVVGVMPPGFSFPANREVWTPIPYDEDFMDARGALYLRVVGRLAEGVTADQAASRVEAIGDRLERAYPEDNTNVGMTVFPLHEAMVGDVRPALLVLLGAVGFVLLIACANVANLLLARAASREGELAVRTALGAGRGRLIRQLLTESVILGVLGGGMGLLLALCGTGFLVALQPQDIPRLAEVEVDGAVVAFTGAVALLMGLLFGLVPALQSARPNLTASLKEGGRGALTGKGSARLRGSLVVAEMALAVVLLAGAGLLINSFARLQRVDPGFVAEGALSFELALPATNYEGDPERATFYAQLIERLEGLPGVRSAGAVIRLPLSGTSFQISFEVEGWEPAAPGSNQSMQIRPVTPDYFQTMGIPLVRGRGFRPDDRASAPQVALLSEAAVRRWFPDEDPIGKRITLGWGRAEGQPNVGGTVVGIVGDVRHFGLDREQTPVFYVPHAQVAVGGMDVVVRTAVPPFTLAGAVRREVHALDPDLPLNDLRTLDQLVGESISQPRFYTLLLSIFAAVALALAAIGIFGVMSYAVAQRTREIGIRVALGADPGSVRWLVVGGALALAGGGVGVGLVGALALTRLLESLLYGVSATDPATYTAVAATLVTVACVASYLPARGATRVDPIVALRHE